MKALVGKIFFMGVLVLIIQVGWFHYSLADEIIFENFDLLLIGGILIDAGLPANQFVLDEELVITDVHFAVWLIEGTPVTIDPLFYFIYDDNEGEPGEIITSGIAQNLGLELIEDSSPDRYLVWFDLEEDVTLPSNTPYWLGIKYTENFSLTSPIPAWLVADDGVVFGGKVLLDPNGDWVDTSRSWFQLSGHLPPNVELKIDIKPGSDPNAIQPFQMGVTPVVILSSSTFSAETVDFSTVTFGPDEATPVHKKPHFEDVNNDGLIDMVVHFKTKEIGIEQDTVELCLMAKTLDGTSIEGCDSIIVVPKV